MIKWINWKELNDRAKTNKGGKLVAVDNESLPALKCVEWSFSQKCSGTPNHTKDHSIRLF